MKTGKKVLSFVLATIMALSVFGVAVSAADKNSEYQVRMELSAKLNDDTTVHTADQTLYVHPGDKIYVSLALWNNYYAGNLSAQVFFSSPLFYSSGEKDGLDPKTEAILDRTINTNSEYIKTTMQSQTNPSYTPWSALTASARKLGWPKVDGTVTVDSDNWHFNKITAMPTISSGASGFVSSIYDPNDSTKAEWFMTFPVYVSADATVGQTGKIYLPEGTVKSAAYSKGLLSLGTRADGAFTGKVSMYMDDQYFDLSLACLNVEVVADAGEVDYSALQAKYDEVKNTDLSNKTQATADAFTASLADAKTILDAQTADQDTVDAALADLTAKFNALADKPSAADYTALDAAITLAGTKVESQYTAASWAAMQSKLTEANAVPRNLDVTGQGTIDAAATALSNAIGALKYLGADYTALDAAIAVKETLTQSWYTTDSWSAYATAVAAGEGLSRTLNITEQATVDAATKAITDAKAVLVEADANYTALNAAKTLAGTKVQSDYTVASWTAMQTALAEANAVATGLKAKDQATIDAAEQKLNKAITDLVALGGADYSGLIAEIANAPQYASEYAKYYTTATWSAYATKLAEAETMVAAGNLKETDQYLIDNMKSELAAVKVLLDFNPADYTAVDTALASIPADLTLYTSDTALAVATAQGQVVRGKKINEQATVNGYAAAINTAVAALKYRDANVTDLNAAITKADAVNSDLYTVDSYNAMKIALDAAKAIRDKANLNISDQTAINNATTELNAKYDALVPLGADYTGINAQKTAFEALTESWYTAASWADAKDAYDEAVIVANTSYDKSQQSIVDAAASKLAAAITALVEEDADYSAVTTAKNKAPATSNRFRYTDTTLAAVDTAIAAVTEGLKAKDQSTVDGYAAAINAAIADLEFKPFDYTIINGYVTTWNSLNEDDYTPASWALAKAEFDSIDYTLTLEVRKYAQGMLKQSKLKTALEETLVLAGPADYAAVNAAITAADALNASDWTEDSYTAVTDAKAAVITGLNSNHQSEVDAMAAAINTAISNLVAAEKVASYTALDAALAQAAAVDQNKYTTASLATLAAAVTAGKAVDRNLKESQQSIIDDATKAITDAIAGLVEKDINGAVTSVTYTQQTAMAANDYTFTVTGRADKVQFISADEGTRTYDRYHSKVSIVSYDANGKVVNSLDRALAYEVWTINANLETDSEIRAVAKMDGVWEKYAVGYAFTVSLAAPVYDNEIYSMTLESTSGATGKVATEIITGLDVAKIQFVYADGGTSTFDASTYATEKDGKLVYDVMAAMYIKSAVNTITVKARVGSTWSEIGTLTYTAD